VYGNCDCDTVRLDIQHDGSHTDTVVPTKNKHDGEMQVLARDVVVVRNHSTTLQWILAEIIHSEIAIVEFGNRILPYITLPTQ
jgi:hypothetical protein